MEALEEKDTLLLSIVDHLPLGTCTDSEAHTAVYRVGAGGRAG